MASKIAAVIPCKDSAHFLPYCLQSILGQTVVPTEIVVVDDSSTDDPARVVDSFNDSRIRLLRVNCESLVEARRVGIDATTTEFVCCIDADDTIEPRYFEFGLRKFEEDYRIAVVYSDVEFTGLIAGTSSYPDDSLASDIHRSNFIHAGSLLRREALAVSKAFEAPAPPASLEDWVCWRRILDCGFWGVKQEARYRYNRHEQSLSFTGHLQTRTSYYEQAGLADTHVGVVFSLEEIDGRAPAVPEFLLSQTRQRSKVSVVIAYRGRQESAQSLRGRLLELGYADVCLLHLGAAPAREQPVLPTDVTPLFASFRRDGARPLQSALAALAQSAPFCLLIDAFVQPPPDAIERLLKGMCPDTMLISADVHTCDIGPQASLRADMKQLGSAAKIRGIARGVLGCVLARTSVLREAVERICTQREIRPANCSFEAELYEAVRRYGGTKLDTGVRCALTRHGAEALVASLEPLFDEMSYLERYPDVNAAVKKRAYRSGLEHYVVYGQYEGRRAECFDPNFDETAYLNANPDVREAIAKRLFQSGLEHYRLYGLKEGRPLRVPGGAEGR